MKRLLTILLAATLLLAACNNKEETPQESALAESASESSSQPVEDVESGSPETEEDQPPIEEEPEEELELPTVTAEEARTLLAPDEAGNVVISSAEHLMALSALVGSGDTDHAAYTYVQTGRISLAGYDFTPIGSLPTEDLRPVTEDEADSLPAAYAFLGAYEGGGNIVSGLTVRGPANDNGVGLFGYVGPGASVRNLHLTGGDVYGGFAVGGVAGAVEGSLYNCSFNGSVTAHGGRVGAIAGQLMSGKTEGAAGKITNCFSNAEVGAPALVGGFVGLAMPDTTIADSYSLGRVTVKNFVAENHWIAGGFGGELNGTVGRCFSNAEVYAELPVERVGGFAGYVGGEVVSCYYNHAATENWKEIGYTGDGAAPELTSCTVAELVEEETYRGWDFAAVWEIDGEHNRGLPFLRSAELY